MRKRDLGILLLSAFAIFFSLQHGGDFSYKEAWVHLMDDFPVKYEAERLPPPIVADLNGDGRSEVLVATHDAKIQVLEPHSLRVDGGFSEARVLSEVSLLPNNVRVSSGRRPVAMAAGYIERTYKKGEIRKQILVVVTSGWSVMCFDHNLKKLWENNLQDDFPHGAHHREIAISISNYTLKHGDVGLVIVGGRMEMKNHILMDSFEDSVMYEEHSENLRRFASEKETNKSSGTVELRHFAFFAFAGRSGTLRWSRKTEDTEENHSDASQLIPQHNYKLDAQALNTRKPGEFECRDFRESILRVMPHSWDRREDTYFQLAHFTKHKRKLLKKTKGKSSKNPFSKPVENHAPGKDSSNKISKFAGKVAEYAGSSKSKKKIPYLPTITNYTQVWWLPNVIVAHEKEGIEAIHLATGRTICKLHLPEGGLHADINGDGVLDHVQAVGGNGVEQSVVTGSMDVLRPCYAVATSGVPVREQLFNASICHHSHFNLFQHVDFSRNFGRQDDLSSLEVATPILIFRDNGQRDHKDSHRDIIFLTNRGELTSYTAGGHDDHIFWNWQLSTGVTWSNLPSPSGTAETSVVPTLKVFSLLKHSKHEMILAAGESEAAVISPGGAVLDTIYLPGAPTHALIVDDFSNDGLNDIILVTANSIYGYVQTRQPGALFFSTLLGCLIVIIAVIFVSQHFNSGKGKPRPPSSFR